MLHLVGNLSKESIMCKDNFFVFKENGLIMMNWKGIGWLQEKNVVTIWNLRAVSAFS